MNGYVENQIVILGDTKDIFKITNNIALWPRLFEEYDSSEILESSKSEIVFSLTHKNGSNWVSKRIMDFDNLRVEGKRVTNLYPFKKMDICWTYEKLPQNIGCVMKWAQKFSLNSKFNENDVYRMENFLNKNSIKEMRNIKNILENEDSLNV